METKCKEILKDQDGFGIEQNFSIQGRSTFTTEFVGIISMCLKVITLAYAVLVTFQLVTYSNCNYISQMDQDAYDESFMVYSYNNNLTTDDTTVSVNFNIAFGIANDDFSAVQDLGRYFTI